MPSSRYVLFTLLLWGALAEARGVHARALWFDSSSEPSGSWQKLTLARPSQDDDCTEFARALPKSVQRQLGSLAAFEAADSHERVCAIGPAHVLIGIRPGPHLRSQSRVLLVEKATARVLHIFTLPKRSWIVWAALDSASELLVAYNEPTPETGYPAENPAHVWFVDPRTGRVLQRLKPARSVVATIDERTSIATVTLETGQQLQLPPSGQFCDRVINTVSRSPKRMLVLQTCTILD